MSKATYKKRLDRLNTKATSENPSNDFKGIIELFTVLAGHGVISAETLEKIYAEKSNPGFDAYSCCTTEELSKLSYLCDTPAAREEAKERARSPVWQSLITLDIEDMKHLDKISTLCG